MERYVWELTHHLAAQGHEVMIICERQYDDLVQGQNQHDITVKTVGSTCEKLPRWISMLIFSLKVSRIIASLNINSWIIHSHERAADHDISTFHGSSIYYRKRTVLDCLSPRLHAWTWMEKREVSGEQVQTVVPVSDLSRLQLIEFHPDVESRIESPVCPAVDSNISGFCRNDRGKTIGFMGKEWRRKGLDLLVKSVSRLRRIDSNINLVVAGCEPRKVRHLFRGWSDGYQLLGWVPPENMFHKIDILVLPSRNEPFGMVAAEANAAGLPVIVSDHCGIAPLIKGNNGRVFPLASPQSLDDACMELLNQPNSVKTLNLDWNRVTDSYVALYRQIKRTKSYV